MNKRRLMIFAVATAFSLSIFLLPADAQMTQEAAQQLANELVQMKKLKEQENQILAKEGLKRAVSFYEKGKYRAALVELKKAEELDFRNKEIQRYIQKSETKIAEEGTKHYSAGIKLYKEGNLAAALAEFEKVSERNPRYKAARKYKEKVMVAIKKETGKPPKEKAALPEEETVVLLEEGRDAYKKGDYTNAILVFQAVLLKEPKNRLANDWLKIAERAKLVEEAKEQKTAFVQETEVARAQKAAREEAMMLDVDKAYLPQKKERGEAVERPGERGKENERDRKIKEMMQKLSALPDVPAVKFTGTNIRNVLEQLMTMTGVTVVLDEQALKKVALVSSEGEEPELKVNLTTASPIPLLDLLYLVLRPTGLSYKVEPTYIWISDTETLTKEQLETRTYALKYGVRRTRKVETIDYKARESVGY